MSATYEAAGSVFEKDSREVNGDGMSTVSLRPSVSSTVMIGLLFVSVFAVSVLVYCVSRAIRSSSNVSGMSPTK